MVDAQGNWTTKADELAWIKVNKMSHEGFEYQIKRLDIFETGSAIVAGQGVITDSDENGRYTVTYQSSNVLIMRDGRWQAVASHVSGIKQTRLENDQ